MAEYQLRTIDCYVIPKEVYYQCLWIVRDWERCKSVALEPYSNKTGKTATFICNSITNALEKVPAEYRKGVISLILKRDKGCKDIAHENTWKKYKQVFLYELASELGLV